MLRTKGLLPGRLSRDEYVQACSLLDDLGLVEPVDPDAMRRSSKLAAVHGLRFFDALFVDLAMKRGLRLLTGDARLSRAVVGLVPTVLLRGIDP